MRKLIPVLYILLLTPAVSSAQNTKKWVEVDTVQVPFINGIAVHADLVGAIQRKMGDHGQYELGMRIDLKDRYFPAFELGIGEADEVENFNDESWCKTRAPYFRIGCDFNILRNKHDIYKLFAGVRYGFSCFKYDMSVGTPISDEEPTLAYSEYRDLSATYHWLEGVFGTDAKIWGPLHLGWDVRYRRALADTHSDIARPWYIPGFGNHKRAGFTFNFNVIIAL